MLIGIDLGTAFSSAAMVNDSGKAEIIINRDGERMTPSVVMMKEKAVVVGKQAKENSVNAPYNICQSVKRQMGKKAFFFEVSSNERYTAEEVSAMILRRLKEDAEAAAGEPVDGAVITVPSYFDDVQRKAVQTAGEIAGLHIVEMINEPIAAAIAYSHGRTNADGKVMVFDLGGGTFGVTVLKLSENPAKIDVLATNWNRNLGGFDFDNAIISKVCAVCSGEYGIDIEDDDTAYQELRIEAERAKITLSGGNTAIISLVSQGQEVKVEITREEFDAMIKGYLDSAKASMEMAMHDAGLTWSDLSQILLVGGSTRVPAVQNMVREVTGIEPSHELNPDEAVAVGAAYYTEFINGRGEGQPVESEKVADVCVSEEEVPNLDDIQIDPLKENIKVDELKSKVNSLAGSVDAKTMKGLPWKRIIIAVTVCWIAVIEFRSCAARILLSAGKVMTVGKVQEEEPKKTALADDTAATPASSFEYEVRDEGVQITAFIGEETEVTIPAVIGGEPVCAISHYAFQDNGTLTTVILKDGITVIGAGAFKNCASLQSVTFSKSLETIENTAFRDCTSIQSIHIPEGVKEIGYNAFNGCISLTEVVIPGTVEAIGEYAFAGDTAINRVVFGQNGPDAVMGSGTFKGCTGITEIDLPGKYVLIGTDAFCNCSSMISFRWGGSGADSVNQSLGAGAFKNCSALQSVTFSKSLETIENAAFRDCTSIQSIHIPEGVKEIGYNAFDRCISLTEVVIPGTVETIGDYVFAGCDNVTVYTAKGSAAEQYASAYEITCITE